MACGRPSVVVLGVWLFLVLFLVVLYSCNCVCLCVYGFSDNLKPFQSGKLFNIMVPSAVYIEQPLIVFCDFVTYLVLICISVVRSFTAYKLRYVLHVKLKSCAFSVASLHVSKRLPANKQASKQTNKRQAN